MSHQEMNEWGEYLLYNTLDTHREKWLSYLSVQSWQYGQVALKKSKFLKAAVGSVSWLTLKKALEY